MVNMSAGNDRDVSSVTRFKQLWTGVALLVIVTGLFFAHFFVFPLKLEKGQVVPFTIASPVDSEWVDSEQYDALMKKASEGWVLDPNVSENAVKDLGEFFHEVSVLKESALPLKTRIAQLEAKYPPSNLIIRKLLIEDPDTVAKYQAEAAKLLRETLSTPMDMDTVTTIQTNAEIIYLSLPEQISASFLKPNLVTYESEKPEEVFRDFFSFRMKKGDIIVSEGQSVTSQVLDKLKAVGAAQQRQNLLTFAGISLLFFMMLLFWGYYVKKYKPLLWGSARSLGMISAFIIVSTIFAIFVIRIPFPSAYYLVSLPFVVGSILTCIVFDSILSLYVFGSLALLVSWLFGFNTDLLIYNVVGCVVSPIFLSRMSDRRRIVTLGFILALVNMYIVGIIVLVGVQTLSLAPFVIGGASGIVAAIFAIGAQSLVDQLSLQTTRTRLLELASINSPLLHQMNLKAPGTFNHSMVMAQMVEEAALAIGANDVLAKVGALYHDIGKIVHPQFFAENIHDKSKNPHHRLEPRSSYHIILKHLEAGVELARKNKLPKEIIDFILTHHGTTVMKYFYSQAASAEGEDKVSEKEFAYPGPIPFTKETTIVHLADSIEAIVRAREISTEDEIRAVVDEIIAEKIRTGQLADSDVSIKDLNTVADAFVNVLAGIYHSRVKYPEDAVRQKAESAEPDKAHPAAPEQHPADWHNPS